jgi:hypothetical protein
MMQTALDQIIKQLTLIPTGLCGRDEEYQAFFWQKYYKQKIASWK